MLLFLRLVILLLQFESLSRLVFVFLSFLQYYVICIIFLTVCFICYLFFSCVLLSCLFRRLTIRESYLCFDEMEDVIVAVALVAPKPGIFVDSVKHVLV